MFEVVSEATERVQVRDLRDGDLFISFGEAVRVRSTQAYRIAMLPGVYYAVNVTHEDGVLEELVLPDDAYVSRYEDARM